MRKTILSVVVLFVLAGLFINRKTYSYSMKQQPPSPEARRDKPRPKNLDNPSEKILFSELKALLEPQGVKFERSALNDFAKADTHSIITLKWKAYLDAPKLVEVDDPKYTKGAEISIEHQLKRVNGAPVRAKSIFVPFGGLLLVGVDDQNNLHWFEQFPGDVREVIAEGITPAGERTGKAYHRSEAEVIARVPEGIGISSIPEIRTHCVKKPQD